MHPIVKIFSFIVLFLVIFIAKPGLSHPPSEFILVYDQAARNLHIELKHVSRDTTEHFIRIVYIYVNAEEAKKVNFNRQSRPNERVADIALGLKPGDMVRVKALCSEGGTIEKILIIPEEEKDIEESESESEK